MKNLDFQRIKVIEESRESRLKKYERNWFKKKLHMKKESRISNLESRIWRLDSILKIDQGLGVPTPCKMHNLTPVRCNLFNICGQVAIE